MTAWNKNHFNELGDSITRVRDQLGMLVRNPDQQAVADQTLDILAADLAEHFKTANDGFNRSRWLDTCNVAPDSEVR